MSLLTPLDDTPMLTDKLNFFFYFLNWDILPFIGTNSLKSLSKYLCTYSHDLMWCRLLLQASLYNNNNNFEVKPTTVHSNFVPFIKTMRRKYLTC